MKVIIAGSRGIVDYTTLELAIANAGFPITEVVSGTARGVDQLGELWAKRNNIPVKQFPADWNGKYGKNAGMIRNNQMADYAEALIALWDGKSRGTLQMIQRAKLLKLPTYVLEVSCGD